jgi:hypothetical protein
MTPNVASSWSLGLYSQVCQHGLVPYLLIYQLDELDLFAASVTSFEVIIFDSQPPRSKGRRLTSIPTLQAWHQSEKSLGRAGSRVYET